MVAISDLATWLIPKSKKLVAIPTKKMSNSGSGHKNVEVNPESLNMPIK
jgi:hypothetical protein